MTMTEDVVFAPASNQDSTIVPEGRWTFHLIAIDAAAPSTYSDDKSPRARWSFHLFAELVEGMAKGEQFYFNGEPYVCWRHTSLKNSPRAYARKYTEALLGRPLSDGEIPAKADLIGRRMSAQINYEDGTIDPSTKVLTLAALKPSTGPTPQKSAPAPAKPAAVAFDANGDEVDRALIVSKINKSYTRLVALDPEGAKEARRAMDASDFDEALMDDLFQLSNELSAAVKAALDD